MAEPKRRSGERKLKFSFEDDKRLAHCVAIAGEGDWNRIARMMGNRNGRQCRERWNNYVNPNLRNDAWTVEEINLLILKYKELGPRWNRIAKAFRNRSTNSVKNKWLTLKRQEEKFLLPAPAPAVPASPVVTVPPPLSPAGEQHKSNKMRLPSLAGILSETGVLMSCELPPLNQCGTL